MTTYNININITTDRCGIPQIATEKLTPLVEEPKIAANGWQANCKIVNNTNYEMQLSGVGISPTNIPAGDYVSWISSQVHNTISINIAVLPMQGNLSFGPEAGVYVDRGWLPEDAQTIKMVAVANNASFTQTTNGGEQLLQWNQFEDGGDITLTFDNNA